MGGFADFYREHERRKNGVVRVTAEDGEVLLENARHGACMKDCACIFTCHWCHHPDGEGHEGACWFSGCDEPQYVALARLDLVDRLRERPAHTLSGNCSAAGSDDSDLCETHRQFRGQCSACPPCVACDLEWEDQG